MTTTAAVEPCPLMADRLTLCAQALGRNKNGEFVRGIGGLAVALYRQGVVLPVETLATGDDGTVSFTTVVQRGEMPLYSVRADASAMVKPHVLSAETFQQPKPPTQAALMLKKTPNPRVYLVNFYLVPLSAAPDSIDFAPAPLGGAAPPLELTLRNPGVYPLVIKSVAFEGPGRAAFAVTRALAREIEPRGSSTLELTATPQAGNAQPAAQLKVVTSENGTLLVPLRASSYSVTVAPCDAFTPGKQASGLTYTIDDPQGAVAEARIEIRESVANGGGLLHTLANLPHTAGAHQVGWRGQVTDRAAHPDGLLLGARSPYSACAIISKAGGVGPARHAAQVVAGAVGDLLIRLQRHDHAPLQGRASLRITSANGYDQTLPTVARGGVEELLVQRLAPGNYDIALQNQAAVLNAEASARLAPAQNGVARAQVKAGERAAATFELSNYSHVQFVGMFATPTGTTVMGPPIPLLPQTCVTTYKGEADDQYDLLARCEVLKKAMADAEANRGDVPLDATALKVFMAPEFYFRGRGGGYPIELVEQILPKMAEESSKAKYQDWLFVYGTAIAYFKHEDPANPGLPYRHALRVSRYVAGAPGGPGINGAPPIPPRAPRAYLVEDPALRINGVTTSATPAICKNIPLNRQAPGAWMLRHGQGPINEPIIQSVRVSDTEWAVDLPAASAAVAVGPVELIEPLASEIFNVALVQRGGPGQGPNREALVYKDSISGIDFHGRYIMLEYGGLGGFGAWDEHHRADLHGNAERLLLPTVGATHRNLNSLPNPSVRGGTSEQNHSGLGGGSLFTMAGVNFGMEVCLDHLNARLARYGAQATPGDAVPQVLLIPSWGMDIRTGPSYVAAAGALFNVDGRNHATCAPDAGTLTELRCPDAAHAGQPVNALAADCPNNTHHVCNEPHRHFYPAAAVCTRCAGPSAPAYTCNRHFRLGTPTCDLCGAAGLVALDELCADHGWHAVGGHNPCPTGAVQTLGYFCNAVHRSSTPVCACGTNAVPDATHNCCTQHGQSGYAQVNCPVCTTPMVLEQRQLLTIHAPAVARRTVGVVDPPARALHQAFPQGGGFYDETVLTVVTTRATNGDALVSETVTMQPAGQAPTPLPSVAATRTNNQPPANGGVRVQREWDAGGLTLTSEKVTTTQIAGPNTVTTEVTTTKRTGNVTAVQLNLFATASQLRIFPPIALPPAAVR